MLYVSLVVGVTALFLAWRCSRATKALKEQNARLSSQLYDVRIQLHRILEEQEQAMAQLHFELMRQTGGLKVTGDMTVDEIALTHPHAAEVLAGFHIGGCASCAVDGSTRLEDAIVASGGQLEPVLVALNTLISEDANGAVVQERLRTPNVQLAL
jgi:hypothetical protein